MLYSTHKHTPVSIHTPIQGVTRNHAKAALPSVVSIHTPIQGVTLCYALFGLLVWFQSTHPYRV